jgi:hypothetical protein
MNNKVKPIAVAEPYIMHACNVQPFDIERPYPQNDIIISERQRQNELYGTYTSIVLRNLDAILSWFIAVCMMLFVVWTIIPRW